MIPGLFASCGETLIRRHRNLLRYGRVDQVAWSLPESMLTFRTSVREITKSSSTFSATNISSNIVWLLQLHDTIQMKSILVPDLVAFISQKEKNVWFFDCHLLTCSVRKMVLRCLMQNIDMCLLYKFHQIARLVSHLINLFSKWMCTV